MSNFLGFKPSQKPNYFFVSYNNEDAERVGMLAQRLSHSDVSLWYDYGIEYGEDWERKISEKMINSQAVILFFTKGILMKDSSYVRKEYKMATEFFDKKVYVVMMDSVDNKAVPPDKVPWLIDIQEKQCVNIADTMDLDGITNKIMSALGISSHEDRMNQMIENYRSLYEFGKVKEAEEYLAEYLKGKSLMGKAKCIANIFSGKVTGLNPASFGEVIKGYLSEPLTNHMGNQVSSFFECQQFTIDSNVFTFGNSIVFHRGCRGDAHVINVWRNQENIYTIGGLIEARNTSIYYDNVDDIIYIIYTSEQEEGTGNDFESFSYISVATIEDPTGDAKCNTFRWLISLER